MYIPVICKFLRRITVRFVLFLETRATHYIDIVRGVGAIENI